MHSPSIRSNARLRVLNYLWSDIKGLGRRLRYDLGTEMTIFACAGVILTLFAYIFRDFFTIKLRTLSLEASMQASTGISLLLLGSVSLFLGNWWQRARMDPNSLSACLSRWGESPAVLQSYQRWRLALYAIGLYGAIWGGLYYGFISWTWERAALMQLSMLAFAGICLPVAGRLSQLKSSQRPLLSSDHNKTYSRQQTLILWRLRQILWLSRSCRAVLMLALATALLLAVTGALGLPAMVASPLALLLGTLVACCLALQLAEDLKYSWAEQMLGISHSDLLKTYRQISYLLAPAAGLLSVLSFVGGGLLMGTVPDLESLKLAALGALSPILMPGLLFQIDPRRPAIQVLSVFLAGLLLGTAILAHWLSLIMVPFITNAAERYQAERYYRA